ncbi:hypothetical protein HN51_032666 [Arachis hypogaea]
MKVKKNEESKAGGCWCCAAEVERQTEYLAIADFRPSFKLHGCSYFYPPPQIHIVVFIFSFVSHLCFYDRINITFILATREFDAEDFDDMDKRLKDIEDETAALKEMQAKVKKEMRSV